MRQSKAIVLLVLLFCAGGACAQGVDHPLFDFRRPDSTGEWRLNIFGTNEDGVVKGGSGKTERVSGKYGPNEAVRFSSERAGSYNFISPEISDGSWRNRKYYGVEVCWRGDGSTGWMRLSAITPEGQYSIALRFDGTKTWKTEIYRTGWSRPGTPPIDWSKLTRLYVHGKGTQHVDIRQITLVGGARPIHLEERVSPKKSKASALTTSSEIALNVARAGLFTLDDSGGRYNCRLLVEHGKRDTDALLVELQVTNPGKIKTKVAKQEISRRGSHEADISLPFDYQQTGDGVHLLDVVVRDSQDQVVLGKQYEFSLLRPRVRDEEQVVLWPEPQIWEPGKDRWILPETMSLQMTGSGDSFPAEHLVDELTKRYGVRVGKMQTASPNVRLDYVGSGVRPEGFVLDVDASGVRLQAGDSRGMYYAVRALLDLARQSSFARSEAGILHTHCEDWPSIPRRVYMDFFISERYHSTPLTVEAFKEHIYDQVAGGRYNLYAMQISEYVRYDSHPELAPRNCFAKAELKEIINFARRHYVEVAPGWNSPGHCGWLVQHVHKELQEDGDARTLCTSNPEGMRILKEVAVELLELYQPKFFFMSGDEVNQGWDRAKERACPLCAGKARNELLLEHWTELAGFFEQKGVRPILFDDMLSVRWNGGEPYDCAQILPELPRDVILATWGTPPLPVPPQQLRSLGFTPWSIQTAFPAAKMDAVPGMWRDYDAFGIAETTTWVWSNFTHSAKQCYYSTPSLHTNATCCWNPKIASVGREALIRSDGIHWSNVMQVPNWGARKLVYQPLSIAAACNESTQDVEPGDGLGWMDLGTDCDLSALPRGRVSVGRVAFARPDERKNCILLKQSEVSLPVAVDKQILGLAFAHTCGADQKQAAALRRRFFRKNRDPFALPVAHYDVRYEDGVTISIPVRLGYDVHFWDCDDEARVMPGPSSYWVGLTNVQRRHDPAQPDACVWVMEWKNPRPDIPVRDVTFVAAGTEAVVACLGITAVN